MSETLSSLVSRLNITNIWFLPMFICLLAARLHFHSLLVSCAYILYRHKLKKNRRIVVYSPQIIENYRLQSGEGVSIGFVVIWLLGDLFNLGGAILAKLIPTVIILALYVSPLLTRNKILKFWVIMPLQYSACDIVLLWQIYYYRWKGTARSDASNPSAVSTNEESPLLPPEHAHEGRNSPSSVFRESAKYGGAILFVYAAGVAAWWVSEHLNAGKDRSKPEEVLEWRSQVMGWISAVLYRGCHVSMITGPI
jgi:solute carrier family 66 (lysosomal lysine-arginine transporter), member 1